ncbi:hypothetical protein ACJX0J_022186, partial [Zea mays]
FGMILVHMFAIFPEANFSPVVLPSSNEAQYTMYILLLDVGCLVDFCTSQLTYAFSAFLSFVGVSLYRSLSSTLRMSHAI